MVNVNDEIPKENNNSFLNDNDVRYIIQQYKDNCESEVLDYTLQKASDKMMGYLSEYWKLRVKVTLGGSPQVLHFFIKSIARNNPGKEAVVRELKLFDKEAGFYKIIIPKIRINGLQPWSAKLATVLENDLVIEDLTALGYKSRYKMDKLDMRHCRQTLETIARFHAGTIVYEEGRRRSGEKSYTVLQDYEDNLDKGGYTKSNTWYLQCGSGALDALKEFSKYCKNPEDFVKIEKQWCNVWLSALDHSGASETSRNVISHCDLWNNNILYHYDATDTPDGCVLVDFQAVRYYPPAGDVMLFLYCSNIDSQTRERELPNLLRHYHTYLSQILENFGISIKDVLPIEDFLRTAEEQRKWGLILSACLLPQIWIDDDRVTEIFSDSENFDRILSREKGQFIKQMMAESSEYRDKILKIFEEIVWRYIIK